MTQLIHELPVKPNPYFDPLIYWENFLSQEDINQLLALPQWHHKKASMVGPTDVGVVDKKLRMSENAWLDPSEDTKHLWHKITNAIADVNAHFYQFNLTGCYEPAQLSLYDSDYNGHYDWHVDFMGGDSKTTRKLSMSLLLSDPSEFEGGELQVKVASDDPHTLEQKQGRAWFFPSHTLHRVSPVRKGIRRSLVLWVGGPAFK